MTAIVNSLVLFILLIVTVPLTIAFYQIPDEENITTTHSIAQPIAAKTALSKVVTLTQPLVAIQKVAATPEPAWINKPADADRK